MLDLNDSKKYHHMLIKSGYHSVKITQASGDYGIDLLAKKNQVSYGFQCKRYQKNIFIKLKNPMNKCFNKPIRI